MAVTCEVCQKKGGLLKELNFQEIGGHSYCNPCAEDYVSKAKAGVTVTTTGNLDGYKIDQYIDIESVEIVIGTGVFSEIGGEISDFIGARSGKFEQKLQQGKRTALDLLKYRAFEKNGNAVVAIDLDYTEFSGNRIGLIVNGTVVRVSKS